MGYRRDHRVNLTFEVKYLRESCDSDPSLHFTTSQRLENLEKNSRLGRKLSVATWLKTVSFGLKWTVIRLEDRARYLGALDRASLDQAIGPFAQLVADRVQGDPPSNA